MSAPIQFYCCAGVDSLPDTTALKARTGDVLVRLWRPGDANGPQGFSMGRAAQAYALFHRFGLFANRDYAALCIEDESGALLHVSSIFPKFFRFPFMSSTDLQIGATYTAPEARGQKLAQLALIETVKRLSAPDRRFWYLTEVANATSVAVAQAAGFEYAGAGKKLPRFGLTILGAYQLTKPQSP